MSNTIKVSVQDIKNTKSFNKQPAHRQFSLVKKNIVELIQNNVNIAQHKGLEQWRLDAFLNQTIKDIVTEIFNSKTN